MSVIYLIFLPDVLVTLRPLPRSIRLIDDDGTAEWLAYIAGRPDIYISPKKSTSARPVVRFDRTSTSQSLPPKQLSQMFDTSSATSCGSVAMTA